MPKENKKSAEKDVPQINLTIDGMPLRAAPGDTILTAAKAAGIHIPTMCWLEGRDPLGACRVCTVEVAGAPSLAASCSMPVREGMEVKTNSRRARDARRTVVELMLSEHDGECPTCERSGDCELQDLARELGVREIRYDGEPAKGVVDESTHALVRDSSKCIKCRRCVTACTAIQSIGAIAPQGRGYSTIIGPAFMTNLEGVSCVQCGQCAAVCPTGAITEKSHIEAVEAALDDETKHVVVQTAPAIRAALGEEFNLPPGTLVTGQMTTALRRLGFDAVFDTDFSADLTIVEEGTELLTRLKTVLNDGGEAKLPMFTSCSPGWIQYAEYYWPDILDHLSTCKSPQQMFGALAKTYYAGKAGVEAKDMVVVSIMPCTAKKFEAAREEMNSSGYQDVDYVLTTRELGSLIKRAGLHLPDLEKSDMDAPLGIASGAADIFANTGGVMEAALRTVWEIVTGTPLPMENLHIKPLTSLEGVKVAEVTLRGCRSEWSFLEGVTARLAVAHGLANAGMLLEKIQSGEETLHFVEIMTCPGGCIGGGGQPRFTTDEIRMSRIKAIFAEDEGKELRKSHDNPAVQQLYAEFLGEPNGHKSHELLHTHYHKRDKVKT